MLVNRNALACAGLALAMAACNSGTEQNDTAATTTTAPETMENATFYVGSYAEPDSQSIYLYSLNEQTGELTQLSAIKAGQNPSYLTLSNGGERMYAVNETQEYEGKQSGAVSSFEVSDDGKSLELINQVATGGGAPCYVSVVDGTVLVANYMGGNVAAVPVAEDGKLGQAQVVQHKGTGPNKDRQEKPHAHYIAPSPDGKYVFAVDLGADKVFGYKLENGKLVQHQPSVAFSAAAGSGPRHLAFHPNGKYAYLVHELNSTVTVLKYNPDNGTFSEEQVITTLPADFEGDSYPAAVKVSADGKFVYASNRGHNSIAVFSVGDEGRQLSSVQHMSTGGNWPRDFSISPSGSIMLVANERSNQVTVFKREKNSGKLTATAYEAQVHKPVNIVFRD
ncbi:lactonase family protein [Pontibacter mangrovi]|nr:lactonase family protein [Pontibacter mangrovi]